MSDRRRVVVTGMGAVTPSGNSAAQLWDAVAAGRSAIRVLEGEQYADLAVRIGGQVRDFDASAHLPRSLARRLSPVQHWAIAAADEALAQACASAAGSAEPANQPGTAVAPETGAEATPPDGTAAHAEAEAGSAPRTGNPPADPLSVPVPLPWGPQRIAVIAATGSGPVDAMQAATRALDEGGPRAVPLTLAIHGAPDSAAALLSQRHGILGAAQGVSATCASGAIGLGEGLRRIRHGYADAVLVVGMEDCLGAVNLASNANMRALAAGFEDDPAAASRPFDSARAGFVMSQGAAAMLLESEESARSRGARILAELAGFGSSSDAHHPTAPHPEGRGAAAAVRECLADAGLGPEAVDHINAHGTGTPAGDAAELRALESALGARAREVPLSAVKSSTGHLLGASGVVEAVIAVNSLVSGLLPPILNLDEPEFVGWGFVTGQARSQEVGAVLSTSFGFGGHNGAVLFRARPASETF
ncbi:beta-ketoacyl-[acyl-carrier-protein] synthase family protein [Brevibacterium album]|uniref:beta-ketoacyl-[acyl-carrier-protein] synthase family protein n=1 Tax=Brevibacterium album TaxID=417948 RepID=UPI00041D3FCA|nr:beta-ketoacyl-[acyl-carrier-protein] synthase family protein [Brevibacterium album]